MKTLFSLSCRTAALTAALFFALACAEDSLNPDSDAPETPDPVLNVDEANSILLFQYTGGTGEVIYYVANPAEDGHLTASADANSSPWITDITVDEVNGAVGFAVSANLGRKSARPRFLSSIPETTCRKASPGRSPYFRRLLPMRSLLSLNWAK